MLHKLNNLILVLSLCLCPLLACSIFPPAEYESDPQSRLVDYIKKSFQIKKIEDRKTLLDLLSGKVRSRLEGWSDDQFREAFINSKRDYLKLMIKEVKPVSKIEVQITYELTYVDRSPDKESRAHSAKITNKKLAQLLEQNGKWFITDVKNIKEMIEFEDELSLP